METDNSWFTDGDIPVENPIDGNNAESSLMHIQVEETQVQESCETEVDTQKTLNSAPVNLISSTGTQHTSDEPGNTREECLIMTSTSTDGQEHTELDDSYKPSTSGYFRKEEEDALMSHSCEIDRLKEESSPRLIPSIEQQQEPEHLTICTGDGATEDMASETPAFRNSCDFEVTHDCEMKAPHGITISDSLREHVHVREPELSESDAAHEVILKPMPEFSDPSLLSEGIVSHFQFSEATANKPALESTSDSYESGKKKDFTQRVSKYCASVDEKDNSDHEALAIQNSQEITSNQRSEDAGDMETAPIEPDLQIGGSQQGCEDVVCTETPEEVQFDVDIKNPDAVATEDVEFGTDNKDFSAECVLQKSEFGAKRDVLQSGVDTLSSIAYGASGDSSREIAMANQIESTFGVPPHDCIETFDVPEALGCTVPVTHSIRNEVNHLQNEVDEVINDFKTSEVHDGELTKEGEEDKCFIQHKLKISPQAEEEQNLNKVSELNDDTCVENHTDQRDAEFFEKNNVLEDARGIENSELADNTDNDPKEVVKDVEEAEMNENARGIENSELYENTRTDPREVVKDVIGAEMTENIGTYPVDDMKNVEVSELNVSAAVDGESNIEVSEFNEIAESDEEKNLEMSELNENAKADEEKNNEVSGLDENAEVEYMKDPAVSELNMNAAADKGKNLEVSELYENAEADEERNLEVSELNENAEVDEEKNLEESELNENAEVDNEKNPEASELNDNSGADGEENLNTSDLNEEAVSDEEDIEVSELNERDALDDLKDIEISELHENIGTDPEDDLKDFELSDFDENAEQDDVKDVETSDFNNNAGADLMEDFDEGLASEGLTPQKRGRKPGKKVGHRERIEQDSRTPEQQSRKRGRKAGSKVARKEEEDVCFVCYDGGNLILCDKRSCPKAYHVECTGRESDFFERRGQWFCGWHVCTQCSKSASVHCYTCPHALCSTCLKTTGFHFIRKKRGLCADCYAIVNMIEHNEKLNADGVKVDFNDKNTLEGLFNDYWQETKKKYSLTLADLDKVSKTQENEEVVDNALIGNAEDVGDGGSTDDDKPPTTRQLRLMKRKRLEKSSDAEEVSGASEFEEEDEQELETIRKKGRLKAPEFDGWASKELMDLIQHRKEDPRKQLSLFEVKKILWQYIDENKLINPRRRGQIVCDDRLLKIFGKKRVGRFEMMKLISLHVNSTIRNAATRSSEFFSGENSTVEPNANTDYWSGKKKGRRKLDDKRIRPDPWEYAAINVKNINLIYLKRSVLDELRNDPDLENKVVGAFVRIRIPSMTNKNDTCYRLVQVVGIKQIYDALDPEKVTDVILEILNLGKREEVTADLVSNQDFVEEECRRLRQSVRCGFIKAMTVGEVEERAKALREAKVKDWFEAEVLKFSHLRDRASEQGRKRELRECVEKLKLLNKPEEKERHLNEPFDIDADPQMDPNFESDEEDLADDDNQDLSGDQTFWETKSSTRYFDRSPGVGSAEKLRNSWGNNDSARLQLNQPRSSAWTQKPSGYKDNYKQSVETPVALGRNSAYISNDRSPYMGLGKVDWGNDTAGRDQSSNLPGSSGRKEVRWASNMVGRSEDKSGWRRDENLNILSVGGIRHNDSHGEQAIETGSKHSFSSGQTLGFTPDTPGNNVTATAVDSEKEKIWYYQDPTKTVQGPFTMEQLRKWEKTNLFPLDLRIWRVNESQDGSILLTDALAGRFTKKAPVASTTQMPQISRGPQQGLQANNASSVPSIGLSNTFSVSSTTSGSVNGYPVPPAQGNTGSGLPLGQVHSFPATSTQGSSVQVLPSGPVQVPAAVQGYPPNGTQGPQYQGFPSVPQQGPSVQGFVPGPPAQVPHVNGFASMGAQVPYSTIPGGVQGSIHTPNANTFTGISVQGPSVTGFPQNVTPVPNTMMGHPQGPGFNNPPVRSQGPQGNTFQIVSHGPTVNMPHMGRGTNNPIRDFRDSPVTPGQVPNKAQDNVWGGRQHLSNNDATHRNQNFGSWGVQGRGESGRDASNQRQFGNGPVFRGNDYYHGNDSRYPAKKDSLCRYFVRGMCKKGPACDFRHE